MKLITILRSNLHDEKSVKKSLPRDFSAVVAIHQNHIHIATKDSEVPQFLARCAIRIQEGSDEAIMRYLLRGGAIYISTN